jgi:hypothetical protein
MIVMLVSLLLQATPPPLVRIAPAPAYGSWKFSEEGDLTGAYTTNESGSVFGILCGKTCVFYLNMRTTCTKNNIYPAMINSHAGSAAIRLRCHIVDDRYLLLTEAEESYFDMLGEGGVVGFAIPLENGKFSVSRFSLTGGMSAVKRAVDRAIQKGNESQDGLRDFAL